MMKEETYWNDGGAHYVAVIKDGGGFVAYNAGNGYTKLYKSSFSKYESALEGEIKRGYSVY